MYEHVCRRVYGYKNINYVHTEAHAAIRLLLFVRTECFGERIQNVLIMHT